MTEFRGIFRITRPADTPIRRGLNWQERWGNPIASLLTAWEAGREHAQRRPDLAERARNGELVELPWRGGVSEEIAAEQQQTRIVGVLLYVAMWQGLRGDDLDIGNARLLTMQCSKTARWAEFHLHAPAEADDETPSLFDP